MKIDFNKDEKNLVIKIPIDLLTFAAENHPEWPLIIHDQDKFVNGILFALEYDLGTPEDGLSGFENLLDEAIMYIAEGGEDYVDFKSLD